MTKKPLHWEPVCIDISRLNEKGIGIGTYRGKVMGVLNSLPGETIEAQPFLKRRKVLYAKPVSVIRPSPFRVEPECAHATLCGGCSLQHCHPDYQIRLKQQRLLEAFGEFRPREVLPPLRSSVRNYRCKARLGVKRVDKKGKVLVGFREKMNSYIADIDSCTVLHKAIANNLEALAELIASLDASRSIPQIEIACGEDASALVFRHLTALSDRDLDLLRDFCKEKNLHLYLQSGGPGTARKIWPDGPDRLHYRLTEFDIEIEFHPLDFTQVNLGINNEIVRLALNLLEPGGDDTVIDLFCGIGNFSLPLATCAKRVIGFESSATAVCRAKQNAVNNNISNAEFIQADLSYADEWMRVDATLALLDPPRSGALEISQRIGETGVSRIVYVSCNPKTLGRDSRVLVEAGFQLVKAGVMDMFPHTSHVESIALFER